MQARTHTLTHIQTDGERLTGRRRGKNLPAEDKLAIIHKFQPVDERGQSAAVFWGLCPQEPGSALNGCLLSTSTSKCQNRKTVPLYLLLALVLSGLRNLIDLRLLCGDRVSQIILMIEAPLCWGWGGDGEMAFPSLRWCRQMGRRSFFLGAAMRISETMPRLPDLENCTCVNSLSQWNTNISGLNFV